MKKLFALLLAVAMMLTLTACGDKDDDKGVANKPEDVAEAYVKAQIQKDVKAIKPLCFYDFEQELKDEALDEFGSEEEFFEEFGEQCDADIKSWNDAFRTIKKQSQSNLEAVYGEGFRLSAKAGKTTEMTEEDLEDLKEFLEDDYGDYFDPDDLDAIKEGVTVQVTITYSFTDEDGEKGESKQDYEASVIKVGSKWKVAEHYHVYNDEK